MRPFLIDMRYILSFAFISISALLFGQSPFYHAFQDTLKSNYRNTGTLDSVDVYLAPYQNTLPNQQNYRTQFFQNSDNKNQTLLLSAIPTFGLRFSMGSKLSQNAALTYRQVLDTGVFIQFIYQRNSSNGILRRSKWEENKLDAQLLIQKTRYTNWTKVYFRGIDAEQNFGLENDTVSTNFGLDFQAIERELAANRGREFEFLNENYFSFTEAAAKIGLFLNPQLAIQNKRYTEKGDLENEYQLINFDSTNTNDYWEKSQASSKLGLFFENKNLFFKGGLNAKYWDFDNLTFHSDTTELDFISDVQVQFRKAQLKASVDLNLLGAIGERAGTIQFSLPFSFLSMVVNVNYSKKYPQLFQRTYLGNNLNHSWSNRIVTERLTGELILNSKLEKLPMRFKIDYSQVNNQAFFLNQKFRQDTLQSISRFQLQLQGMFVLKRFFFQPIVNYSLMNSFFVSNYTAFARFGFDGVLLKSKKLKTVIGAEIGYQSAQELFDYSGLVDAYFPINSTSLFESTPKIHVFNSYDLGFLRWSIRFENLEQLFLKTQNYTALGFPIAPFQFRFGVSWDLFN